MPPLSTSRNVSEEAYLRLLAVLNRLYTDYEDLKGKPFFPGLIKYMNAGPVVGMVWEGLDAVKTGRAILGATNPLASAPGNDRLLFMSIHPRN